MAKEGISRFVSVPLHISDDCKGKYVCSGCKMEKPWNGETYTKMRCENPHGKCNGVMELQFINEGGVMNEKGRIEKS